MKIIVSKQSIDSNFKAKVDATIRMAKDCAKRGITSFYMNIPRGSGYSKYDLISRVEELTEKTVYEGHRAVSGESIRFSIAEENKVYG